MQKTVGYQRAKIDLFASQDNDYEIENGMAAYFILISTTHSRLIAHWNNVHSQARGQRRLSEALEEIRGDSQSQSLWQGAREDQSAVAAETQQQQGRSTSRKPSSRVGSVVPVPSSSRRTPSKVKPPPKAKAKGKRLFLDSDGEQEAEDPA